MPRPLRFSLRAGMLANQRMDADGARPSVVSATGTTGRRNVRFPDRAAAPQVMRGSLGRKAGSIQLTFVHREE
jgi:hypothetical protein